MFLDRGGEAGALIAAHDWSSTALGSIASWPPSLRTTVSLLLRSPLPMVMLWGNEGVMLYNDAYSIFAGRRHPQLLGCKVRDGWPEVADFNDHVMRVVLAGETLTYKDQELRLYRLGRSEQVFMDLNYSPVLDENGVPAGVICILADTTERVAADRRLQIERQRQRQMLQQMPGFAALLSGPEHRFDYVNDAYIQIAGQRAFVGRTVREVLPELDDQGFYELLDRVYSTGTAFSAHAVPIALDRLDGQRFIDFQYEPVRDDQDAVIGIFVGGYDVTDQVRGERRREALLKLDGRLRAIGGPTELAYASAELLGEALGGCRVGYGEMDAGAGTIAVGRTWSLPGLPDVSGVHDFMNYGTYLDELRAGRAVTVMDVDVDPRTADRASAFRAIGVRACLDVPVMEAGCAVAEVFVHSAMPRVWSDADVGLAREFAERTRATIARRTAEASLRNSEARYRTLFETIDQGFCVVEFIDGPAGALSDYVHREANPAYERHAGLSNIVGKTAHGVLTAQEADEWLALFRPVLVTGEPIRFERELVATRRHLDVECFRIEPPARRQLAILFQDVTARKNAELALRELNETLERRVGERTAELMQVEEALRQAQKMEAVGQLTGGIAHDFNNLLAGISGSLELLDRRLAEGRTYGLGRYIHAAQTSARRAAALTQRLLAFSRRQTLDPKPTNANRLIAGMEELIRRTVGPSIELEVVGAGGLWLTQIDPAQLESALLNLAINARDAMPAGGRITIETANTWFDARAAQSHELPPGQYLSICVTDTGTGMTREVMERAFDPFFTTKPLGQGTGLGLSMVHGFVRQSGGQVRIYTELGKGTTMCLYLPRFAGEITATEESGIAGGPVSGSGEVVLVIDDEPIVRMLIVEVLLEAGYSALEAEDGASGLKILQSAPRIDLLITDVGLPGGMNGRQVADAARVNHSNLKVLFVTGYAENAVVGNGHLDPGMAIITKPFVMAELSNKVREMIETIQ